MKNFEVLWSETAAAKASLLNVYHGSYVGLGWMPLRSCLASIAPLRGGYCYLPSRRRKCQGRRVGTWTQDYCSWPVPWGQPEADPYLPKLGWWF